jgi:cell division ATPase FtsA
MSEENLDTATDTNTDTPTTTAASQEEISKMVQARVEEELASIKSKLNDAYASRDEAVKKAVTFEEEKKAAEIARLEEEGKHKEAGDIRLAELTAKLEARNKQVTELTRDNVVRDALKGMDFRNDTAADFAYRDVVGQLVQNEEGQWVHRTGESIKNFIDTFKKDEDKSFLFKPKQSSGAGMQAASQSSTGGFDSSKSLNEMTTAELMAAAEAGHLDGGKDWR